MRNGDIPQRNRNHLVAGEFTAAADGVSHFGSLAESDAYFALFIANDNEGAEVETATTFDDLGRTVDEDNLLHQFFATAAESVFRGVTHRLAASTATGATLFAAAFCWFSNFCHSIFLVAG